MDNWITNGLWLFLGCPREGTSEYMGNQGSISALCNSSKCEFICWGTDGGF